ncbi:CFC_collapsed_G0052770.mRNA.1.CDS.1 [Saccharomyces cerevisiae]|nr:CFC_collapsed_G0052770.mRNA.1.CDS.1 [Saccharomyces cerevisiae]
MSITKVHARTVYDSRGNPTVEVEITTENGLFRAISHLVPPPAFTKLLNLETGTIPNGWEKGVTKAVSNVNSIIGPAFNQVRIMCNQSEGHRRAHDIVGRQCYPGVSLCVARAAAAQKGITLYKYIAELADARQDPFVIPVPFFNVLNGGAPPVAL